MIDSEPRSNAFDGPSELRGREAYADLLRNARRQADERNLDDYLVVDADFHQWEGAAWGEILDYVDRDVVRQFLRAGGRGRPWVPATVAMGGVQDVSGRIRIKRARADALPDLDGTEREVALIEETMRLLGLDYVVLFPSELLHLGTNPQVELEPHLARAHARWMTERVLDRNPRILTLMYLPFGDPEASLELVERYADHPGVVGFMITSVRYDPIHDRRYAALYATLDELGMPLGLHTAYTWYERSMEQLNKFLSVHALGFPHYNAIHLTNWVINGMPERYPNLPLIFIESGLAWLPFLMERLDHEYRMRSSEAPLLERLPSEYIRDCHFTSQPLESAANPRYLQTTMEMISAETQLLYASDWPHWDFDLPSRVFDLPFLDDDARRAILGGNAARLFGLSESGRAQPSPST